MFKRLNDINAIPEKAKEHILYTIEVLIKFAKIASSVNSNPNEELSLFIDCIFFV